MKAIRLLKRFSVTQWWVFLKLGLLFFNQNFDKINTQVRIWCNRYKKSIDYLLQHQHII